MAEVSAIEWTDSTVNFWWGCTRVGPGCDHCYADTWAQRFGEKLWGAGVPRRKIKSAIRTLHRLDNDYAWWAADAVIAELHPNRRRRVFIQSMSDLFDKEVPDDWFDEAWIAITICSRLDIQIVTKRISLVEKRLAGRPWPKHAGLIITVVNQAEADRDIPRLIALKAKLGIPWVGLSMEPLLGGVVLRPEWLEHLDWVIVGGESGLNARALHPDWVRSLRDQCAAAGAPFFFKQWGEWAPSTPERAAGNPRSGWRMLRGHPHLPRTEELYPENGAAFIEHLGKKAAGRLLDGIEHNGFPRFHPADQAKRTELSE